MLSGLASSRRFSNKTMINYDEKFKRELLISQIIEIAKKVDHNFTAVAICLKTIATAIKCNRENELAEFMTAFDKSCNRNGKTAGVMKR